MNEKRARPVLPLLLALYACAEFFSVVVVPSSEGTAFAGMATATLICSLVLGWRIEKSLDVRSRKNEASDALPAFRGVIYSLPVMLGLLATGTRETVVSLAFWLFLTLSAIWIVRLNRQLTTDNQ